MSSKLLGCLNYKISKVIKPQHFVIVWQDSQFRIRVVFYGNSFLNKSQRQIVRDSAKEILFQTRKNNPFYSYTCLPYELRNEEKFYLKPKKKLRVFFINGLCHNLCS